MSMLMLFGCAASVLGDYEAEKAAVLANPPPLANNWTGDLRIQLSKPLLHDLVQGMLDEGVANLDQRFTVEGPLGIKVVVKPDVSISSLKLSPSSSCDGCIGTTTDLDGSATFKAGPLEGTLPIDALVEADVELDLVKKGNGWGAVAKLKDINSVKLQGARAGKINVAGDLKRWIKQGLQQAPEIPLGTFGGEDLPLRGIRAGWVGDALEIEAATNMIDTQSISSASEVKKGWSVTLHPGTALAFARKEAFETGTIDFEVAADPRGFVTSPGGGFDMHLRLWRLQGQGWWRDYQVTGDLVVKKNKLVIEPDKAEEGPKSKGAGIADPLALLVEGKILDAVTQGMNQAIPLRMATKIGKRRVKSRTDMVQTTSGRITLQGDLVNATANVSGKRKLKPGK